MVHTICPECGNELPGETGSCPDRGNSIPEKKIPVHFWRRRDLMSGVTNTGRVLVDGELAGSAGNGASFEMQLSPGAHTVVIESTANGDLLSIYSNSTTITVPCDARSIEVEMKPKSDAMALWGSGGMAIVVGDVVVKRGYGTK